MEKVEEIVVKGYVDDEQLCKFQKCLVCESTSICDSKRINERIAKMGLGEITVKRIQGRYFLIEVFDEELMDLLKQTKWSYLKEFFCKN